MKRIFLLVILGVLATTYAMAESSFKINAPSKVVVGQQFQVSYQFINLQGSGLKAPEIAGCTLLFGPAQSSMYSTEIINGVQKSQHTISLTYTYRADKEGTYTIPEASVKADGKTWEAPAKQITVLPADKTAQNGGVDINNVDTHSSDRQITGEDVFIRLIPNKTVVYEQEPIACTIKLYTKYNLASNQLAAITPTFEGCLIENVDMKNLPIDTEHYNGQNYTTIELAKYILFPHKTGKLTLNSGSYELPIVQVDRIYNGIFYINQPTTRQVSLKNVSVAIQVKPLPTPAPNGFNGAVGDFTATSKLSTDNLRTNEAASLIYTITGSGNVKYLKTPEIKFPNEFEDYKPTTDCSSRNNGSSISGTMTIEYTIVPQTVGNFNLEVPDFVYFNPAKGAYETIDMPQYTINVSKGVGTSSSVEQQQVKVKNTDILHIITGDKGLEINPTLLAHCLWYWLLYPILIIILIAVTIIAVKRHRANADVNARRMSKAGKIAKKRLAEAARQMKAGNRSGFYDSLLKAMWGYLSDKLTIPGSSLTRDNVSEELLAYGAPDDTISHVISILDDCEMARYTPENSQQPMEVLYNNAYNVMNELQNIKRK